MGLNGPTDYVKAFVEGNDYFENNVVRKNTDMYVPSNNRYPHIHIGKNFVVYSKSKGNHSYLVEKSQSRASKSRTLNAKQNSGSADIMQICDYLLSQFCD